MKIKPCPFCGTEAKTLTNMDGEQAYCAQQIGCLNDSMMPIDDWNRRPSEDKLKLAIDCALRAMELAMDNNISKPVVIQRMKQAIPQIKTILGITKKREF